MISYGYTPAEIAKRSGKSVQHINETLELTSVTKATANLIADKAVSANTVKQLLKNNTPDEVEKKVTEIAGGKDLTGKPVKKRNQVAKEIKSMENKKIIDMFVGNEWTGEVPVAGKEHKFVLIAPAGHDVFVNGKKPEKTIKNENKTESHFFY